MKKTYIEPTMIVVKLPARHVLLYVSAQGTTNSGEAAARGFDVDEEDF